MEISGTSLKKSLVNALHRYHVIIFVLVVLGSLISVVLLLNNIIVKSGDSNNNISATDSTTFDKATIDRLNTLKTRDETPTPLNLSNGRTNPFVE